MAGLVPLPQTIHHHTTRLSHREAYTLLSSFLETAETNPAYRPDSTLSAHGVVSSSASASQNLTLNHLGRILKGIAGERVGGTNEFDEFFGYRDPRKRRKQDQDDNVAADGAGPEEAQGQEGRSVKKQRQQLEEVDDQDIELTGGKADPVAQVTAHEEIDDWQDKEDYEHAQIEETREVLLDDEDPTRMVEDGTNEVAPEELEVDVEDDGQDGGRGARYGMAAASSSGQDIRKQNHKLGPIDKQARKQAKKERKKEEARARQKSNMQ